MLSLLQQRGESKAPVAAGRALPRAHTPPPKGNRWGARVDEIGGSGHERRNSGSAALRAQLTPELEGTCSARGGRRAAAAGSPSPPGAGGAGGKGGGPGTPHVRPDVSAEWVPARPAYSAAERRGPVGPGAPGCAGPVRVGGGPAGPHGRSGVWHGEAVTFRDPRPGPRAGAGPARPRPRGPARARRAGPLLGGAPRSQHMVGGAPPRPAETGCSRYRISDRQRRGAGARTAARTARRGRRGGGRGARRGGPRRGSGRGAGAGRGGAGARGSPAGANLP